MSLRSLVLPLALTLAACSGDAADTTAGDDDDDTTVGDDDDSPGDDDDDDVTSGDDDDDDNSTETGMTGDTGEVLPVVLTAPEIVYGLPNVDNNFDFMAMDGADDDIEFFEVTLSEEPADTLRLSLSDTQFARLWYDGIVVASSTGASTFDGEFPWPGGTFELGIEFGFFDVDAELLIEELDASGNVLQSSTTRLRSSPVFLNHHLLDSELVVAVDYNFYGIDNDAFLAAFDAELGADFEPVPGNQVGQDVWIQDEIEFATGSLPDGRRMDIVVDSIRDRGLDPYPENNWRGEQFGVVTFGNGRATTFDSFGNFEVTPPIDGYPMGRVYYGAVPGTYYEPNDGVLTDFLENQLVQDPIHIDTSWLCVGHVDEFMAFIPDDTAPRGFRLLFTDTNAAWDLLDTLDPNTSLPRYAGGRNHNIANIGEITGDNGLRNLNDDVQAAVLDPILDQLTTELALTPDEIILFPGIFEEPRGCGSSVAALIPGMVNLVSTNFGGDQKLFMADPFLRSDVTDPSTDPMIDLVEGLMPATTDVIFVDDWDAYHMALGEVHCGSNTLRTPAGDWWTDDPGGHQ